MIRLRQVALVASDLDTVVVELCGALGLDVCYVDPGVGEFGLHNALMLIGDQFLEVVSPTRDGTTAGRLLDRRARDNGNGDGGYMAIYEVDDLDARVEHVQAAGVRVVWSIDLPTIRARHLHPRDVGGALVSIDQPASARRMAVGRPDMACARRQRCRHRDRRRHGRRGRPGRDAAAVGRAGSGPRRAVRPGERTRRGDRRTRSRRHRPRPCR